MKTKSFTFSLLAILSFLTSCAFAQQYSAVINLTDSSISTTPYTNRNLRIYPLSAPTVYSASVVLRAPTVTNTDNTGQVIVPGQIRGLYKVIVLAPPFQEVFTYLISSNTSSTFSAATNLVADSTSTFPAGTVAWAAAVSDLRYAPLGAVAGNYVATTNGYSTNQFVDRPHTTNLVNYGNALISQGASSTDQQFGLSASASGGTATALGTGAQAQGANTVSIGASSGAIAARATAIGEGAGAEATDSTAVGFLTTALSSQSIALGSGATTTRPNQLMIGDGTVTEINLGGHISIYEGSGSPAGTVSAPVGSLYLNTAGGSGTTLYVKESGGSGSTGWVGK